MVIIAVAIAVFAGGYYGYRSVRPSGEHGVFPVDPPTPYLHFRPPGPVIGTVLVVHGLDASKEIMQTVAMALADGGFDVYAVDMPGHGDSPSGFSIWDAFDVVPQVLDTLGPGTIAVGHSMGGAILGEVAAEREFSQLVLYSPGPIPVDRLEVDRLLVISGGFDPPGIDETIPRFVDAPRGRGFWWRYAFAAHSTALFHPSRLEAVVRWLGGRSDAVRARARLGWLGLMALAGIAALLALPAGSASTLDAWGPGPRVPEIRMRQIIVDYVFGVAVAAGVLYLFNPLGWLDLFATDYLMGMVLVTGLVVWRGRRVSLSARGLMIAVAGAALVIGLGIAVGSPLAHVIPSGRQWFRVPVFALVALPLFLQDQTTIGAISGFGRRWITFLATRGILWAAVVTSVQLWSHDAAFLVLVMHLVVVFWTGLWFAGRIVARRSGEDAAGAVFMALIQAWAFAAIFVGL